MDNNLFLSSFLWRNKACLYPKCHLGQFSDVNPWIIEGVYCTSSHQWPICAIVLTGNMIHSALALNTGFLSLIFRTYGTDCVMQCSVGALDQKEG